MPEIVPLRTLLGLPWAKTGDHPSVRPLPVPTATNPAWAEGIIHPDYLRAVILCRAGSVCRL